SLWMIPAAPPCKAVSRIQPALKAEKTALESSKETGNSSMKDRSGESADPDCTLPQSAGHHGIRRMVVNRLEVLGFHAVAQQAGNLAQHAGHVAHQILHELRVLDRKSVV